MTVLSLESCDRLLADLRQANLLTPGQLQSVTNDAARFTQENPDAEASALAEFLVAQGRLSPFQAETLLQGAASELVFREYVLVEPVGPGIVGSLFRGVCRTDGAAVDLEILRQKSKWNTFAAFRQKKAFAEINHPAVVPFMDVGTLNGVLYLVWPRSEGQTLDMLVEKNGPMLPARVLDTAIQMAEGLQTCHERGIFHGLLNPGSVLVKPNGKVSLRHFGIGGLLADQQAESLLNTRATAQAQDASLECASLETTMDPKHRDPLSDQYSLGAILYFALTGQYPFPQTNPVKKLVAMKEGRPTPLRQICPAVSERLAAVIERMMQRERTARYANLREAAQALSATLRTAESSTFPAQPRHAENTPLPMKTVSRTSSVEKPVAESTGAGRASTLIFVGVMLALVAVIGIGVFLALH